jgi:hypothetical protein
MRQSVSTPTAVGASRVATGGLAGIVVLLFYVLTWPPLEMYFATRTPPTGVVPILLKSKSGSASGRSWTTSRIAYIPKWVAVVYDPLRRLREMGEFNPLRFYWEWWDARW